MKKGLGIGVSGEWLVTSDQMGRLVRSDSKTQLGLDECEVKTMSPLCLRFVGLRRDRRVMAAFEALPVAANPTYGPDEEGIGNRG